MNIKNIIIGIIIAVVLVMFLAYGTNLVYKSPKYENYCPQSMKPYTGNDTQQSCEAENGTWIPQNIECIKAPCPIGYCDYYAKCQPLWDVANKAYSKSMFIISIVIGVIIIAISALLISIPSIAGGLMLGSLFFIIYGTARYWGYMDDYLRFIILGIALVILIYLGYKLANRETKEKEKRKK